MRPATSDTTVPKLTAYRVMRALGVTGAGDAAEGGGAVVGAGGVAVRPAGTLAADSPGPAKSLLTGVASSSSAAPRRRRPVR